MSGFTEDPGTLRFSEAPEGEEGYFGQVSAAVNADPSSAGRFAESESAPPAVGGRFSEADGAAPSDAVSPAVAEEETLPVLEERMRTYNEQLEQVLALIGEDPDNEDVLVIKADVEAGIAATLQKLEIAKRASYVEGAYVEAQTDWGTGKHHQGQWDIVKILSVSTAPDGVTTYKVVAVGYSQVFELGVEKLRPFKPSTNLTAGSHVEAVNPNSGLWAPADVDTVTDKNTVWVLFKGSKNIEEVALYHVRLTRGAKKRQRQEDKGAEDTEHSEKKKQKKEAWRERVKEMKDDQAAPRKSWQDFCNKKQKLGAPRGGRGAALTAAKPASAGGAPPPQQQKSKFLGSGHFSRLHQF
eukprot:TRINITY_DN24947_c0_g1_i1.p1 TRINITY_DN24947_c0_g1~~TRINITY_DN24947_c0_g1_i1.p1  ORF type:complete len:368 (+),score=124.95 TRINITY_DN24947_c0_g1_i1:43-1104(+)